MKRIIPLVLALLLTISLVGCTVDQTVTETGPRKDTLVAGTEYPKLDANGPHFNIILGHGTTEDAVGHKTTLRFKELIEERSGGLITVNIYPNTQLGNDREMIESVQVGDIQMVWQVTAPQVSFMPELAIMDVPNAVNDLDVAYELLSKGQSRETLEDIYRGSKLVLIDIYPQAFREMSSNIPVNAIEDFKGINIRTMDNPYHMAYWRALGANPTPLAFGELYISLQQGLLDAQENPLDTILSAKLAEQQDYIITTDHVLFAATFVMNKEFYDSMPKDYQDLLTITMADTNKETIESSAAAEEIALDTMVNEYGVKVIELSDELKAQIVEKVQPVWEQIFDAVGEDVKNAFLNGIEEAEQRVNNK